MSSKFSVSKRLLLTLIAFAMLTSVLYVSPIASGANGPRMSYVKFLTIKTPDAQVKAMKLGEIDMEPGLIRPGDVDELSAAGKKIVATPGGHYCYITFNLRQYTVDGELAAGDPPSHDKRFLLDVGFRHAIAHLIPKDVLIGTIFKYIVVRVDTVIPPQMAEWSDPNIQIHEFNPGSPFTSSAGDPDAAGVLYGAGYFFQDKGTPNQVDSQDYWSYDAAGNDPLGTIDCLSPSYEEAPTSYTIVKTSVEEMRGIGLNNINHLGMTFTDMLDTKVYPNTFSMFFLCWTGLSADPDNLWAFFNGINDAYQGRNHPGLHEPVIDALTTTIHTSLNKTVVKAAAFECQELLMDPTVSYGLSYIPIYSRNFFDAYSEYIDGLLNVPLTGSNNGWSLLNMRWTTPGGPHGDNGLVEVLGTDVLTLNPLTSNSADEVNVWGNMFDGLIGGNPYTRADATTGMASAFSWAEYDGTPPGLSYCKGQKFSFTLKPGLKWHCGTDFTVEDIIFSFYYLNKYKPALWTDAWDKFVGVEKVDASHVNIYYNRTSLWLKDGVSGYACLLPKHIWNDANRDGIEGDEVTDWQHFNLWAVTHPPVGGSVPKVPGAGTDMTCLCGTGAWVFETLNLAGGWARVQANPNYYMTQADVDTALADMFYWYGNVNKGEETPERVDMQDMTLIGLAWASSTGGARWDLRCDLIPSGFIDAEDLRVSGASFGKKKVYP
jgi:ABC-type transport system substrate-binding protein